MKIFHSFDTSLRKKKFKEHQNKWGIENVLCFGKSRLYRIVKVIIPLLFLIVVSFILVTLFDAWVGETYLIYFIFIVIIADFFLIMPILGKYIEYKMDFVIIIPDAIIKYDQKGLFKKNVITINSQGIKTISVQRSNLLYSIFNNGDLIFLSESIGQHEEESHGEVTLHRIAKPEKKKDKIIKILKINY